MSESDVIRWAATFGVELLDAVQHLDEWARLYRAAMEVAR